MRTSVELFVAGTAGELESQGLGSPPVPGSPRYLSSGGVTATITPSRRSASIRGALAGVLQGGWELFTQAMSPTYGSTAATGALQQLAAAGFLLGHHLSARACMCSCGCVQMLDVPPLTTHQSCCSPAMMGCANHWKTYSGMPGAYEGDGDSVSSAAAAHLSLASHSLLGWQLQGDIGCPKYITGRNSPPDRHPSSTQTSYDDGISSSDRQHAGSRSVWAHATSIAIYGCCLHASTNASSDSDSHILAAQPCSNTFTSAVCSAPSLWSPRRALDCDTDGSRCTTACSSSTICATTTATSHAWPESCRGLS